MKKIKGGIDLVPGFFSSGIVCGIKQPEHKDLALIVSENLSSTAAVFTQNKVQAAPVLWSRMVSVGGHSKAIVVNSGNANACTGKQGMQNTEEMAKITGRLLDVDPKKVYVCSTGVIGLPLPMEKIRTGIPKAFNAINANTGSDAAEAIMTTDTFSKSTAVTLKIDEKEVRIGGIAKGSGMIYPNMATMLAFVVTDLAITPSLLKKALTDAADISFNRITVDGETSTNDTLIILANSFASNNLIDRDSSNFQSFCLALNTLCSDLAEQIIYDGEGATKFVRVRIKGGKTPKEAKDVAMSIANSNLVKTAIFGRDANWGRIISAAGNSGVQLDFNKIDLSAGNIQIITKGTPQDSSCEDRLKEYLDNKEIIITLHLNMGACDIEVLTTDLTTEYIRINSAYRT